MDDMKLRFNTDDVVKGTNRIKRMGKAVDRASIQQGKLTKRSKRFTMGIQQAGFQVGDFAAQVQNGTSAMVALGQQGPQLLGIFGALGAIAGAGLAIGTALIKAKNAGKELQFDFKGMGAALKDLFSGTETIFQPIGAAFRWLGRTALGVLNGIIIGVAGLFTILQSIPSIFREAFNKGGNYIALFAQQFKLEFARLDLWVSQKALTMQGYIESLALEMRATWAGIMAYMSTALSMLGDNVEAIYSRIAQFIERAFKRVIIEVKIGLNKLISGANAILRTAGLDQIDKVFTGAMGEATNYYTKSFTQIGAASAKAFSDAYKEVDKNTYGSDRITKDIANAKSAVQDAKADLDILNKAIQDPMTSVSYLMEALAKLGDFNLGEYFKFGTKIAKENLKELKTKADMVRDSLSSSIESAMMKMIDGTTSVKDAFKAMAVDIIKELYRIYVVQQITGLITGAIGGSGPAPAGSFSAPKPAANGGPVSAGGRYIVGERGPELFTPAMSGTITPNSSVGSSTTVVQNINVSTGVQQTVRAEIRQMMPQIADSAKGAVLDAKRRGGSYGRAMA